MALAAWMMSCNSSGDEVVSRWRVAAPADFKSASLWKDPLRAVATTLSPRLSAARTSSRPKPDLSRCKSSYRSCSLMGLMHSTYEVPVISHTSSRDIFSEKTRVFFFPERLREIQGDCLAKTEPRRPDLKPLCLGMLQYHQSHISPTSAVLGSRRSGSVFGRTGRSGFRPHKQTILLPTADQISRARCSRDEVWYRIRCIDTMNVIS
jgi:hypothetical protein